MTDSDNFICSNQTFLRLNGSSWCGGWSPWEGDIASQPCHCDIVRPRHHIPASFHVLICKIGIIVTGLQCLKKKGGIQYRIRNYRNTSIRNYKMHFYIISKLVNSTKRQLQIILAIEAPKKFWLINAVSSAPSSNMSPIPGGLTDTKVCSFHGL